MNTTREKKHTLADWSVLTYYSLISISGLIAYFAPYPVGIDSHSEISTYLILSTMFLVFGLLGVVARWIGARVAELIVLCSIGVATLIQAGLSIYLTGAAGAAVAARLLAAPWVMVPYGLLRQRTVISRRDIAVASRAVANQMEHPDE